MCCLIWLRRIQRRLCIFALGTVLWFKGCSICSHVVATAEVNGNLQTFLESTKKRCIPTLTSITDHGMPSGSGRKGGLAKQKRKRVVQPQESRSVRCFLDVMVSSSTTSHLPTCKSLPQRGL